MILTPFPFMFKLLQQQIEHNIMFNGSFFGCWGRREVTNCWGIHVDPPFPLTTMLWCMWTSCSAVIAVICKIQLLLQIWYVERSCWDDWPIFQIIYEFQNKKLQQFLAIELVKKMHSNCEKLWVNQKFTFCYIMTSHWYRGGRCNMRFVFID